ncbi:ABC transporter ATP-binding protein [Dongia soli]|uniref:ABC transporter ATP-binding protein n=1 Tax=Dongia soli TaxID=600628 RepID=A0ABU5E5J8_9PROT|nr:ABC transporter ATP-binding protein [Dongia soli]MDY0881597.1 ABC transporter ATP-binding protein [Dongia soli]
MSGKMEMAKNAPVLEIRNLSVGFNGARGQAIAVNDVSLTVPAGKVVGIVGESGSGKTTLISAALGLISRQTAEITGEVKFEGRDILNMSERELRAIRGTDIAMIFQDPMTALNPSMSIGTLMTDIQYRDQGVSMAEKRRKAVEMLRRVGIPDPESRLTQYPHEFSGGMRQRICIAMALLGQPRLLIADEPTTALDVTMEAQIIHLLRKLQQDFHTSIVFVSHNLGIIAEICDYVAVLYSGCLVEQGEVDHIFHNPQHPYTKALLACDPALLPEHVTDFPAIPGEVPGPFDRPAGCIFQARCNLAADICRQVSPPLRPVEADHAAACHMAKGV